MYLGKLIIFIEAVITQTYICTKRKKENTVKIDNLTVEAKSL